jgi:hypothetical protein
MINDSDQISKGPTIKRGALVQPSMSTTQRDIKVPRRPPNQVDARGGPAAPGNKDVLVAVDSLEKTGAGICLLRFSLCGRNFTHGLVQFSRYADANFIINGAISTGALGKLLVCSAATAFFGRFLRIVLVHERSLAKPEPA